MSASFSCCTRHRTSPCCVLNFSAGLEQWQNAKSPTSPIDTFGLGAVRDGRSSMSTPDFPALRNYRSNGRLQRSESVSSTSSAIPSREQQMIVENLECQWKSAELKLLSLIHNSYVPASDMTPAGTMCSYSTIPTQTGANWFCWRWISIRNCWQQKSSNSVKRCYCNAYTWRMFSGLDKDSAEHAYTCVSELFELLWKQRYDLALSFLRGFREVFANSVHPEIRNLFIGGYNATIIHCLSIVGLFRLLAFLRDSTCSCCMWFSVATHCCTFLCFIRSARRVGHNEEHISAARQGEVPLRERWGPRYLEAANTPCVPDRKFMAFNN